MAYTRACTDARAALAPLLSGGAGVCHWQSSRRFWPDTRRLQLPLTVSPGPVPDMFRIDYIYIDFLTQDIEFLTEYIELLNQYVEFLTQNIEL